MKENLQTSVYDDIRIERAKQDLQWGGAEHDDEHTPTEWRSFREKQEDRANAVFSVPFDLRRAALVKLAALAVAQIEAMDRR